MVKSTSVPAGTKTGKKIIPPPRPSPVGKRKREEIAPRGKKPGYETR